jgi:hypothetical protein
MAFVSVATEMQLGASINEGSRHRKDTRVLEQWLNMHGVDNPTTNKSFWRQHIRLTKIKIRKVK